MALQLLSAVVPLLSLVLVNEVVSVRANPLSSPEPFPARVATFIVPSPSTKPIAIDRIFSRIHLHNSALGVTETVLAIARASDGALLGGVIADIDKEVPATQVERDFVYETGSQFILQPGDAFVIQAYRFVPDVDLNMTENNNISIFGVFAAMAYHELDVTDPPSWAPKFIELQWVSTGNYLLGLKDDGSIWKSTAPAANPLVFVQVLAAP